MIKSSLFTVSGIVAAILCATPVFAQTQNQSHFTANSDGSCTIHYTRGDVRVDNGGTYHQQENRGQKSGIIYVPDRMYQCKGGHISVVKQ